MDKEKELSQQDQNPVDGTNNIDISELEDDYGKMKSDDNIDEDDIIYTDHITDEDLAEYIDRHLEEDGIEDSIMLVYSDMIEQQVFLGEVPFEVIVESIENQFNDYIDMSDTRNNVDLYYTQLTESYNDIYESDGEEYPIEKEEALNSINLRFVDFMMRLFYERLSITIPQLESGSINSDDLEFIFRRLYEFFILGARENFKAVISMDIVKCNPDLNDLPDDEYFAKIQELMDIYSPLITTMSTETFLEYRNDDEMTMLYSNGDVAGNFLRKYSPKLYRNEEFTVELVNHITNIQSITGNMEIDDKIAEDLEDLESEDE